MKIKQAKLAQSIRGETSNILNSDKYNLSFEGNMLHISAKVKTNYGPFIVFPANIAYMELDNFQEDTEKKTKK